MAHNGIVYLLHFERSYRHARHYIGFTQNLEQRLEEHRAGRGSPLVAAAIADGIDFQLAAIWEGDRHDERRLHRQKNTRARLCPLCVASEPAAGGPMVDLVDELLLSVLGGIAQPATLTALQAQLRRRGKRIGSVHGRLELLALRGRVSKTWLLGEIAWTIVAAGYPQRALRAARDAGVSAPGGRSVPSQGSHPGGCVGVGERPRHPGGPRPEREGQMSTTYRRRRLSESEREQRRNAERERVKEAAEQLLTSEGWQRWVRARSMFRRYSAHNTMLLALDFHLRGIEPEPVAGFRVWLKLGRCVRKGEHGIRIAARVTPKKAEPGAEQTEPQLDKRPVRFTTVAVFGLSQTDPLPGVEQLPLEPPCEPLTGDSHAHLLEPLGKLATELGYTVTFEEIAGATGGWCDAHAKRIVVDSSQAVNGQVRTLVHELVHALGVNYQTHTRPQAEVIVDTATLIILSGAGLDASGETIPYVAGWGETGALEAVTEHAELIDRLARTVENAIAADTESPATIAG